MGSDDVESSLPDPSVLRSGLYLGPQQPHDRGQRIASASVRTQPDAAGGRSSVGKTLQRPLVAAHGRAASARPGTTLGAGGDSALKSALRGTSTTSPAEHAASTASWGIVKHRDVPVMAAPAEAVSPQTLPQKRGLISVSKYEHETLPRGIKFRGLSRTLDGIPDTELRKDTSHKDEEVEHNIRQWYQLMQTFKKQPESAKFVYLRYAEPEGSRDYHPYSLIIVEHAGIKDQRDYLTMSATGVTRFWAGQRDFFSLAQWEREYFLYMQLTRLRAFRGFRAWKALRIWHKGVALAKARQSKDLLKQHSFYVNVALRASLLHIRASCEELQLLQLHALDKGRIYSLEEFVQLHAEQALRARAALEDFSSAALNAARVGCLGKLSGDMEEQLINAGTVNQDASAGKTGRPASARANNIRAAVVRAVRSAQEDEFAYAMMAARRSEKRRLYCFVRLLDYVICSALSDLLHSNCVDVLAALTPADRPGADDTVMQDISEPDAAGKILDVVVNPAPTWGGPIITLQVLLESTKDELILEPPAARFEKSFAAFLSQCSVEVLGVPRLSTTAELQEFAELPIEGGGFDVEGFNSIITGEKHQDLEAEILLRLGEALASADELRLSLEPFREMVVAYRAVTSASLRADVESGRLGLDALHDVVVEYRRQLAAVQNIATTRDLGILRVDLEALVQSLLPAPERCLQVVSQLLPQLASEVYQRFIAKVHDATTRLTMLPTTVEEFAEYIELQARLDVEKVEYNRQYEEVVAYYDLLAKLGLRSSDLEYAAYQTLEDDVGEMRNATYAADIGRSALVERFRFELYDQVEALNKEVLDIRLLAQHDMLLDDGSKPDAVLAYTSALKAKVVQQREQAARINRFQRLIKLEETKWDDLNDCADDVDLRHELWTCRVSWQALTDGWKHERLDAIDSTVMEDTVTQYHRAVLRMERGLLPNKIVPPLRASVNAWRDYVPVVRSLCNRDMKDRHWLRVNSIAGQFIERGPALSLTVLLELKMSDHRDELAVVSTEATQEAALEVALGRIQDKWKAVEFTLNPYKEVKEAYTLGAVEEVAAVLEDSLVMMMTISASRFASGIRAEVEKMEKQLRLFSDTLDEWLDCQRQWLSLETIFNAADIQRQLPAEAKAFSQVDRHYREIMRNTKDRPNALQAGTQGGLLELFRNCNQALDAIQKNLELYLELKRVAFPRFYFLSNEELLEILSQTRNPQAVQPHLQKCFDGIRLLDFGDDVRGIDILAILSAEGERIGLGKNLKARGPVESWLTSVESSMRAALRSQAKRGAKEYATMAREEWVLANPAQLVIVISNIFWCQQVESRLSDARDPVGAMMEFYEVNVAQLSALICLVRKPLSPLERKIVCAIITIDVHNRDIVGLLVDHKTASVRDFDWQMQLRYEMEPETDNVVVRQVNARFEYGWEYLGAQPRLVVTPMTDRCYMTLTGALHMHLGGAPAGPAGTGKTETTKDLGKALGIQCVVFNCGENLDYKFMSKFFSGLSQCGAWACFDEFNRIDIEVLSVIAQQLLSIQRALHMGLERFLFEGREMRLVPTLGVFITMNPGYAGRTELPDNLKALFRPMSMMIPDYALVAEVMLFSEGFSDARRLSHKMVKLYKLASEQLSQQSHYDFGMRALKSVLVMAGTSKRSDPDLPEDNVLIRAMREANIPKFLFEDARLFDAIVSDLFPGVDVHEQEHGSLQAAISASCDAAGLQPVQAFVTKVVQLHETCNVRFGVMLVGPTGGGKTCAYQTLQAAHTRLRQADCSDPTIQVVHSYLINPKSVSMGELYGQHNSLTNEWADGLASTIIRAAVLEGSADHHWVVFDGPVDALWVENMNTVLDDNCMLCLPNGERIKLDASTMRMLFEVADLAVASPATVSRCGMVYVPPEDMGWRPLVRSWLARLSVLPPGTTSGSALYTGESVPAALVPLHAGVATFLWGLFDQFVDPLVAAVRKSCRKALPLTDINMVASVAAIFQALTHPTHAPQAAKLLCAFEPEELQAEVQRIALGYVFCFSCIWGIGGNLEEQSWVAWDKIVRELFDGTANFPESGSVFDFCTDPIRNYSFAPWDMHMGKYKYDAQVPYFQILVPTLDTTRYGWLLHNLLASHRPVLFTGNSGVGKTAVIMDTLQRIQGPQNVIPTVFNFSAQTSSSTVQAMLEARLERKRKRLIGAPAGKHVVLFIDDINMPAREQYGAQPPIEFLRLLLDFRGFYDRKKLFWKDVDETTLCAACGPPGGGRQEMSPRFMRHFLILNLPSASEACMRTIFSAILGGFFDSFFTAEVKESMCASMVSAAVQVYSYVSAEMLPTPQKAHYTFNLRDLAKVFQGIVTIRPGQCTGSDPRTTLVRLWAHEHLRVFHDRLVTPTDKSQFCQMLHQTLSMKFDSKEEFAELFGPDANMFGDYMRLGIPSEERVYEEIARGDKLSKLLDMYLEEYNAVAGRMASGPLSLVFFSDAVQHINRIARVLRQPRGSALLIGVGGSGKQSLARFASFMADTQCRTIELTRNYGLTEFREDIKLLYRLVGVQGKQATFLFTDNHVVNDLFLEDINSILNSGEITSLFAVDEKERILSELVFQLSHDSEQHSATLDRVQLWSDFINRVRDGLHLVLCFSPVGSAFRSRCRQFPSLINCTTIDWFTEWPSEALLSVAKSVLSTADLSGAVDVAKACVHIHSSVSRAAERFFVDMKRRYYVTPKGYLDLLSQFAALLARKRKEMTQSRERLLNGLTKLQETNVTVDKMQREQNLLQPILHDKTESTQKLLVQVEEERVRVTIIAEAVTLEEQKIKMAQGETHMLADDAQADLLQVLPTLEAAEQALSALNKNDIIEIRTFTKPPVLVQLTLEGVNILLQEKPDWDTAKRVLGEPNFIKRLVDYDKDNIPDKVVRLLKRVVEDPVFTPDQVAKQSKASMSLCLWVRAMDTYSKVIKIVEPKRKALLVAQAALNELNSTLEAKQKQLAGVQAEVEGLENQLTTTQNELASLQYEMNLSIRRLENANKLTSALADEAVRWRETADEMGERMQRLVGDILLSAAFMSYLGAFNGPYRDELVARWTSCCQALAIPVSTGFNLAATLSSAVEVREWNIQGLPSDTLSTDNGVLVNYGSRWPLMLDPQDQANRWVKAMESKNGLRTLRTTDAHVLRTLESCVRIGNPVLLEDVGETLDPALDPLLVKNIFTQGGRTLLRLGDTDVDYDMSFKFYMTTKLPNPHYLPEVCIRVSLINFTVTKAGLEDQLLGDVVRKERPDLEEAKDRLVLSISGDKRQLQDLEDRILKLLKESTGNILDDEVLINTLNNSKLTAGIIQQRVQEAEVTERHINVAREVYRVVPVRGSLLYFVISDLGKLDPMYQYSLAYFVQLFDICLSSAAPSDALSLRLTALLDYTTEFMHKMVCRGLFEKHKPLFSFLICSAIQHHKGSFTSEEWSLLLRGGREVDDAAPRPLALASWMEVPVWSAVQSLEAALPVVFGKLSQAVVQQARTFQQFIDEPGKAELQPAVQQALGLGEPLGMFHALLLVKALCEHNLLTMMHGYVTQHLGARFTQTNVASLMDVFSGSTPATPIIFILSQGADPVGSIARLYESLGRDTNSLHVLSLGQGQGPIAESITSLAMQSGSWVVLQNCHLARSWMPALDRLVEGLQRRQQKQLQLLAAADLTVVPAKASGGVPGSAEGEARSSPTEPSVAVDGVHKDFRLWLTSMPVAHFPVPVLQTSIKVTMEPPKGIRANLLRTYGELPEDVLERCSSQPSVWRKLVFACSFFHASLQERRRFGALGWNIPYEFSAGDLTCALSTLYMFLAEPEQDDAAASSSASAAAPVPAAALPWAALLYVTGEINYGGRVTDDNDRRLLMCILHRYYSEEALMDGHPLAPGSAYLSPPAGDLASYLAYLQGLPLTETPEVFGLHANADITFNMQASRYLIESALAIQPNISSSPGSTRRASTTDGDAPSLASGSDAALLQLATDLHATLPSDLDLGAASVIRNPFAPLSSGHDNSLGTVLSQELDRFNLLLSVLKKSLTEIQRAVQGLAVMSPALEAIATAITNNQVPSGWQSAAYPSLKPLGSWMRDLVDRVAFMADWLYDGEPPVFWLPGLFFPQGFMTAVMQNQARKTHLPIDRFAFRFHVLSAAASQGALTAPRSFSSSSAAESQSGVLVRGLYVESATWNEGQGCLAEALPRQMHSPLPVVHFEPVEMASGEASPSSDAAVTYDCPLYKTSVRAGVLSTTGQSTNFVLHMVLPIPAGTSAAFWIQRGTAALCALDY